MQWDSNHRSAIAQSPSQSTNESRPTCRIINDFFVCVRVCMFVWMWCVCVCVCVLICACLCECGRACVCVAAVRLSSQGVSEACELLPGRQRAFAGPGLRAFAQPRATHQCENARVSRCMLSHFSIIFVCARTIEHLFSYICNGDCSCWLVRSSHQCCGYHTETIRIVALCGFFSIVCLQFTHTTHFCDSCELQSL